MVPRDMLSANNIPCADHYCQWKMNFMDSGTLRGEVERALPTLRHDYVTVRLRPRCTSLDRIDKLPPDFGTDLMMWGRSYNI